TLAEVKRILGLAQILSGEGRRGRENCQASSDIALRLRDPWLISQTRLAMAEAIFAPSDAQAALAMVAAEQPNLRRWGQLESQWRHRWRQKSLRYSRFENRNRGRLGKSAFLSRFCHRNRQTCRDQ